MTFALLLALFLPDVWVLCQINNNSIINAIICSVMALFLIELVTLSAVDATYMLSFFFWMDIFGTVSMIFDLSFAFGSNAEKPVDGSGEGDQQTELMFLRATRAAKLGARAGRLSRVLRIFRTLTQRKVVDADTQGIGSTISNQLTNVLAMRVALLTILLVMTLPLFALYDFPMADYAPKAWVERLSEHVATGRGHDLEVELDMMANYYKEFQSNRPFKACAGAPTSNDMVFSCDIEYDLHSGGSAPQRTGSVVIFHTDIFCLHFNMQDALSRDAAVSLAIMLIVILVMVVSGLALSSVVTEMAVRPFESMLNTVRQIAQNVLKVKIEDDLEDVEDEIDIYSSNEMNLLGRVVEKLAAIATFQTGSNLTMIAEEAEGDDKGVLDLLTGGQQGQRETVRPTRKTGKPRKDEVLQEIPSPEDFGLSTGHCKSMSFNALVLKDVQGVGLATYTIARFHVEDCEIRTKEDLKLLDNFLLAVRNEYPPNPFHSFSHALDCLQNVAGMLRRMYAQEYFHQRIEFSMLIAAISHDLGHVGYNNVYLTETSHELALRYNDQSPLENMHCAKLYTIVGVSEQNIFSKFSRDEYKESRKTCLETILHTDMAHHGAMVKELNLLAQMNSEVFSEETAATGGVSAKEKEVFNTPQNKSLMLKCLLHSADVSNPCRPYDVTVAWADRCLQEFFEQGDQEKTLGVPVGFLNDRNKVNRPNSQIAFIEFAIAPLFVGAVVLWPGLSSYGDCLNNNISSWESLWLTESKPTEEEANKVKARVLGVKGKLSNAKTRTSAK
jgi:hypothetical protein